MFYAVNDNNHTQSNRSITGMGFSPDLMINGVTSNANYGQQAIDRLRGVNQALFTEYAGTENTYNGTALLSFNPDGVSLGSDSAATGINAYAGYTSAKWFFKRAPGFFDEVAYTGIGSAVTISHNLGVAPELILVKMRSNTGFADQWVVGSAYLPSWGRYLWLNLTDAVNPSNNAGPFNNTAPTSSVFSVGNWRETNGNSYNLVAYLFASLPNISKVGSYTSDGTAKTIDAGFSGNAQGARFVLIKRTDAVWEWYVFDSARGITTGGNDPYLLLSSAAAQVTNTNYIEPNSAGFGLNASTPINTSGGTYIYLAIH